MMDIDFNSILTVASSVVATASVIAAFTPTPTDNAVLAVLRKVLDALAFNFGGAKNQPAVDADKFKR